MAKTANNTRAAAVNEERTYDGEDIPLVRFGESIKDMGESREYLDDHDSQVVLFEARSDVPRHLQVDLFEGEDFGLIYSQHIHPDMLGDILGNDEAEETEYLDHPPWHDAPWARQEPHAHLLEGPPETNALVYRLGEGELLEEGSEDFELSEEDHLLTITGDHSFVMTTTTHCFQDDDYQYHHALDFLEGDMEDEEDREEEYGYEEEDGYEYHHALELLEDDVADEEDVEDEDEGLIYTDGHGNCYTFEPHDAISDEEGLPENEYHLDSLQQAPAGEELVDGLMNADIFQY